MYFCSGVDTSVRPESKANCDAERVRRQIGNGGGATGRRDKDVGRTDNGLRIGSCRLGRSRSIEGALAVDAEMPDHIQRIGVACFWDLANRDSLGEKGANSVADRWAGDWRCGRAERTA